MKRIVFVLVAVAAAAAFREGKLPFPDGAIIAALHYSHASSEENNKVFGRSQSFVAGTGDLLTSKTANLAMSRL